MPPEILRQVLGESGREDQLLELAEAAFAVEARAPHVHLAQALDGGGEPGEAVRGMLGIVDAAGLGDLGAHPGLGRLQTPCRRKRLRRSARCSSASGPAESTSCSAVFTAVDIVPSWEFRDAAAGAGAAHVLRRRITGPAVKAIGAAAGVSCRPIAL